MNTLFAPLRELEEFDQLNTSMKKVSSRFSWWAVWIPRRAI